MNLRIPPNTKLRKISQTSRDVQRHLQSMLQDDTKEIEYSITISTDGSFTFDVFEHGLPTSGACAPNSSSLQELIAMSLTEFEPNQWTNYEDLSD